MYTARFSSKLSLSRPASRTRTPAALTAALRAWMSRASPGFPRRYSCTTGSVLSPGPSTDSARKMNGAEVPQSSTSPGTRARPTE